MYHCNWMHFLPCLTICFYFINISFDLETSDILCLYLGLAQINVNTKTQHMNCQ